jgi:hypothetical protein
LFSCAIGFLFKGWIVLRFYPINLHPMNSSLRSLIFSAAIVLAATPVWAQSSKEQKAPQTESEIIAKARAEYPLKTCVVSDESLGSMGDAVAFVHRAPGKPDRVFFLCCEGCIDDLKAEPGKFLKKLDDAASKGRASGQKSAAKERK